MSLKNSRELYWTIQNSQSQVNQLKRSTLIYNKQQDILISKCNKIVNTQSTLQTFGFKGSKIKPNPNRNQKTHMEQTTLTELILADDNQPSGDRIKKKTNN